MQISGVITKDTAARIWLAYREIEAGRELVANMEKAIANREEPFPRDPWTGKSRKLQLGLPTSENSTRLFDVPERLAVSVINAHIAEKMRDLAEANEQARIELEKPKAACEAPATSAGR